jgi:hypothetical protein
VRYDASEPDFATDLPADETDDATVGEFNSTSAERFDASMLALEASAARTDTQATLDRLESLTRSGQLEPEVREDFVHTLRAITRTPPRRASEAMRNEWQIETTAAVLHFSRLVLRLTYRMAPPIER